MNLHRSFLLLLLWLIPLTSFGQRYISGCITDAETGESITGASVFIANTTIGASTHQKDNAAGIPNSS